MLKVVFDMETGDPDDILTLALLCGHPKVDLQAVTVTPGTPHQVGVVRYVLSHFGKNIPVGAFNLEHKKNGVAIPCVSDWHYKTFGQIPPSRDAREGAEVLYDALVDQECTLITGGPLKNLGQLLNDLQDEMCGINNTNSPELYKVFVQGGFAGDGVVPPEKQLPKFKGLRTCPTYNLNGDPEAAKRLLRSNLFQERRFVSKNVCHGVSYDQALHERLKAVKDPHPGLAFIMQAMEPYMAAHPEGKKLHDPLAACCAIDPSIGEWAEVELYREKGEWGSRLCSGSGIQIIIGYDHDRFVDTLCGA